MAVTGVILMEREEGGHSWLVRSALVRFSTPTEYATTATKTLSGALDRFKIEIGGDSYDAGEVSMTVVE